MKEKLYHCPNECAKPLFRSPDAYVMKLIEQVKMKCKNEGCSQELSFKAYVPHMKECPQ